ncbi:MAG: TIGR01212 family radical SAM protein, partial [Nitrospirota bacterium]|nr:TIGR01212 family radical SAM protein [Nitrospirota bacterium]
FPFKVYKIALDAGFTCPNRDGLVAYGGCIYCENRSFSPNSKGEKKSVAKQIETGIEFYRKNFRAERFIVYFQAYTNTYGPVNLLKELYDEALSFPEVIGLSVGTRPDCLPDEVLDLLALYSEKTHLWVEIGLQSMHNQTLLRINRGHTYEQFKDAIVRTKLRGMRICVHAILGLPGETREMMMQTAEALAGLPIDGLKIHHLYIADQTILAKHHKASPVKTLSMEEYVPLACDFLERIPPHVAIQRLTGELKGDYLIAPLWNMSKKAVLAAIEKEFARRGTCQGKLCNKAQVPVSLAV